MSPLFNWFDAHQVLSAFVLLFAVIATGLWISHHQVLIEHLQYLIKTAKKFPFSVDGLNVANIQVGKRYEIKIAGEKTSFLVRNIQNDLAVFEVLFSPTDPSSKQGRQAHGWTYEIKRDSIKEPYLYSSALAAACELEYKFSPRKHAHA